MADEHALGQAGVLSLKRGNTGGDAWFRMSVPGTECPRIPKDFLEEERMAMGAAWFEQEYMCGFVDNGRDVVEAALDDGIVPLCFS